MTFDADIDNTIVPGFTGTLDASEAPACPPLDLQISAGLAKCKLDDSDSKSNSESSMTDEDVNECSNNIPSGAVKHKKHLKQTQLNFTKLSRADWLAYEHFRDLKHKETEEDLWRPEMLADDWKVLQKQEAAHLKKQRQ